MPLLPISLLIIALVLGAGLITLECFMPGLGVPGILGGLLSLFGIIFLVPYIGWKVIFVVLGLIVFVMLMIYLFARSAERGGNPLVLDSRADKASGFSANDNLEAFIGASGTALTELRPSGIALVNDRRLDVVTDGGFLEKDTPIVVTGVQGRRVIVAEKKE